MTVFIVLDATYYPVAIFRDRTKAMAYLVAHATCHMISMRLDD